MDVERARDFVSRNDRAVLATTRANGRTQLTPVTAGLDHRGRVAVSTREGSMKVRNLRRDPHASLLVLNPGFFGEWVRIDGTVEIETLPEAMEGLVEMYRNVKGEHPDWDEYRQAMIDQQRVLLLFDIEEVGPTSEG
ncbi:MAG TPA: PPOX class F420-dependent oxidoreductase [Acidimicrobiales bacterium]|nr:PPOX class F420-dependent oxidoreductase [Acidimicrobiales bacterium]